LLFSKYDVCLNLGGFANVSFESDGSRIAFDVAPVNIVLNVLANALGKEYDDNGELAATGSTDGQLLEKLDALSYYLEPAPKSLSREWLDEQFMPVIGKTGISNEDKLHTICEHIAVQVRRSTVDLGINPGSDILVTGGGALNGFLVDCIRRETQLEVTVPDKSIIEYKEALIFALLGLLRIRGDINCLSSVTGAQRDCSCGVIVSP
jgi:anhydro-N-acetylmuramic acid kinase